MPIIWRGGQRLSSIRSYGRVCARRLGNARLWRAGERVSRSRTVAFSFPVPRVAELKIKLISARRRKQHASRVRSSDYANTREAIGRVFLGTVRARIRG